MHTFGSPPPAPLALDEELAPDEALVVDEALELGEELVLDEAPAEVDELSVPPAPLDELEPAALGSAPGHAVSSMASAAGTEYQNTLQNRLFAKGDTS